jgi:predicted RNase H-like HicB family nuclease
VRKFTAVIEKCRDTGLFVGYVPGLQGAHSQGASLEELAQNLREVIELLLEDGDPVFDAEFVGTHELTIP